MRLFIERVPNHWVFDFTTSSSSSNTPRAGSLTLAPEPEAKVKVALDPLDCKAPVPSLQFFRRKRLQKHIRNAFSCFTRSVRRHKKGCKMYLSEFFPESDYGFNEDFSWAEDNDAAYQSAVCPPCSEIPTCEPKIELPGCNWLPESVGTPVEELMWKSMEELCELPSEAHVHGKGTLTLNVAQPLAVPASNATLLPEGNINAIPELSPQSASQKDLPVSPFTVSTVHSATTPPQRNRTSSNSSPSPDENLECLNTYHEGHPHLLPVMRRGHSILVVGYTASNGSVNDSVTAIPLLACHHAQDQQQHCASTHPIQQPILQRASTFPIRLPTAERQRLRKLGLLTGTFEMNNTSTFTRCYDNAASTTTHHSSTYTADDGNASELSNQGVSARDRAPLLPGQEEETHHTCASGCESTDKKQYDPVRCKQCGRQFGGQYASGNLTRHVKHIHVSESTAKVDFSCRICKLSYKRSDALRNHLWKKHHLAEAKPKMRSTS